MNLSYSILTISDTRQKDTDESGKLIETLGEQAGLHLFSRIIVPDDVCEIKRAYNQLKKNQIQLIITNGGTGIAKRDVTFKALQPEIVESIPGFGELFRYLSYLEIGSHAMASKAMAGINNQNQLVFSLPGSPNACRLAMEKLILPEIDHLIFELNK